MDQKKQKPVKPKETVKIGEFFEKFQDQPIVDSKSWPRFRGNDFDNICKQQVKLADKWDKSGPKKLWAINLGEGHAAAAVHKGRVYILDYNETLKADSLRCLSLENGKDIWNRWYKVRVKRNHGMSRTIPAVTDKYIVTIGPRCQVMCVATEDGALKWGLDLVNDFGTKVPLWYTGQCPLIADDTAVIAPVGKDILMMGVDCETGKIVWTTPNRNNWKMSHSSIMPMTIVEKKMYVYVAVGGIVGVSAEKNDRGKILWETTAWDQSVTAPSPLTLGKGKILITAGYGAGSMTIRVKKINNKFDVEVLQRIKVKEGLATEQQTPIFYKGHIFSILPKDAGRLREQFICADPDDITKIFWTSGKTNRFGLGPYILADNKFYILDDNGVLSMIRATTNGYEQLGRARVLDGHDAWGPIALAGTKMLLRDSKKMVCIDVGVKKHE